MYECVFTYMYMVWYVVNHDHTDLPGRSHNIVYTTGIHIHVPVNSKVKGIVRENLNKVIERGEKLDDLGEKAGT